MERSGRANLPDWVREPHLPGYRAAHSHESMCDCERLFGTEMLFDGWDADVLLLAKDVGPASVLWGVIEREGSMGWRHAQRAKGDKAGWRTNERLVQLASQVPGKKLYGSACANLMRDDGKWSGILPQFRSAAMQDHLTKVLRWVVGEMPNLKAVGCLGSESWFLVTNTMGATHLRSEWAHHRDEESPISGIISGKHIHVTAHFHPGARVATAKLVKGWSTLAGLASGESPRRTTNERGL